jgi:putative transposase
MTEGNSNARPWRRKRNRLDVEAYRGAEAFAVTAVTWQRVPVFSEASEVDRNRTVLTAHASEHGFRVLAYCFMPDHFHLLVEGSEGSDLVRFMKAFKQATSFDYKKRTGDRLWQRSYHDHIVRGPEDLEANIDYILANPVQAGLTDAPYAYEFSGGVVLEAEAVAT